MLLVSMNISAGMMARADKCDKVNWTMDYDKPLIFSEFGGGAKYGFHGDKDTIWSEEFQRDLYEHQVEMFKKVPFLRGTSPWILTDFQSPKKIASWYPGWLEP